MLDNFIAMYCTEMKNKNGHTSMPDCQTQMSVSSRRADKLLALCHTSQHSPVIRPSRPLQG